MDGYSILNTIGEGSFGKVKLALNIKTKKYAAVKIIYKKLLKDRKAVEREILILRSIRHKNIITLEQQFEDEDALYIVLDYASGGELFDKIIPDLGVDEDLAHFYFHQLISAVDYFHGKGVCHRDLKPENILLDDEGNLKISDFGLATVYKSSNGARRALATPCGTPPYVAPEIISQSYDGELVDVWSCGIILFVLLAGNTPWDEPTKNSLEFITYSRGNISYPPWNSFSSDVQSLLLGMLAVDPQRRFSLGDIKCHSWFRRHNALLASEGRCSDPVVLATRLLSNLSICHVTPEFLSQKRYYDAHSILSQPDIHRYAADDQFAMDRFAGLSSAVVERDPIPSSQPVFSTTEQKAMKRFGDIVPTAPLTRFYSYLPLDKLFAKLEEALKILGAQCKLSISAQKIAFSTHDKRRCPLKGEVQLQSMATSETKLASSELQHVNLVRFHRGKGDPVEFKRFFTAIVKQVADVVSTDESLYLNLKAL